MFSRWNQRRLDFRLDFKIWHFRISPHSPPAPNRQCKSERFQNWNTSSLRFKLWWFCDSTSSSSSTRQRFTAVPAYPCSRIFAATTAVARGIVMVSLLRQWQGHKTIDRKCPDEIRRESPETQKDTNHTPNLEIWESATLNEWNCVIGHGLSVYLFPSKILCSLHSLAGQPKDRFAVPRIPKFSASQNQLKA